MEERTKSYLRTVFALLFLASLGAVLARPVFESNRPARPAVLPEPTPERTKRSKSPKPSPTPTPTPEPEEETGFVNQYPRACLAKLLPEPGLGHVAVASFGDSGEENQVTIAALGDDQTSVAADPPLEWSVSGGFLATRGPQIWTQRGDRLGIAKRGGDAPWAWSPIADCLVTWNDEGLVVLEPAADRTTLLLRGDASSKLRFSTPPSRLLMVGKRVYDLRTGELVEKAPMSASGLGKPRRFSYESYCTELGDEYEHESCSWNESLVAATLNGRLVYVPAGGGSANSLTTDSGYTDAWPTWGPRGTGILFVRMPDGGGPAEIWLIREGSRAADTGLRSVDTTPRDWSIYLDWSVDRPLGINAPVPGS